MSQSHPNFHAFPPLPQSQTESRPPQVHNINESNHHPNNNNPNHTAAILNGQIPNDDHRQFNANTRSNRSTPNSIEYRYSRPGRPQNAALVELLYGGSVYLVCVFLPSFPRYVYQAYLWISLMTKIIVEKMVWWSLVVFHSWLLILERCGLMTNPFGKTSNGEQDSKKDDIALGTSTQNRLRRYLHKASNYLLSTSTSSLWEEFNQQRTPTSPSGSNYTWGFGHTSTPNPNLAMVLHDVRILTMLAVTLAIIRVWFVHMLVPEYLAPSRLQALTRSKSSHLLSSSSYRFGGISGWERAVERVGVRRESLSGRCSVRGVGIERRGDGNGESENDVYRGWYDRMLIWASYHWYR